jgi:predicted dehydrogenase
MPLSRRQFLQDTAAGASVIAFASLAELRAAESPNSTVVIGVMGTNGRGTELAKRFAGLAGCKVAYVCDVDQNNVARAASKVNEVCGTAPQTVGDFRRILDDQSVDALVIGAPDHWHAPATILGCQAGKHVYCEKPAAHNPHEGEMMVAAARKYKRQVQLGTQRRSMPAIREAVEKLHAGAIGKTLYARAYYNNPRPSIGRMKLATPPATLDYALWQGPAPEQPYREYPAISNNPFHYHWHWNWHWGTGELGNNGVHTIDYPLTVTSAGGQYRYDDDQQTPDTNVATFDFGDKAICWEGRSWYRQRKDEGSAYDMAFYGSEGSLTIGAGSYHLYDLQGKEIAKVPGDSTDKPHTENFLDAIRQGAKLNAEIEEGYKSTLLCLLGNIAYRTGHTLHLDPKSHQVVNDPDALALWSRQYNPAWEPKV